MTRADGSRWPTANQELLLRAALLPAPQANEAWLAWRKEVDLEGRIDDGSFRLLPLVCRNLERQGATSPDLPRLRGIYRQTWLRNTVVVHKVAAVLREFESTGIQTTLLKGAPLALLTYGELGARPMSDVDILVHRHDARPALALLLATGWTCRTHPDGRFDRVLGTFHAIGFTRQDAGLDLHWHAMEEANFRGADLPFWAAARDMTFEGVATHALCPADMLLHVCAHGSRWDPVPPIRWVADAYVILQRDGAGIDWQRLVEQTERLHLSLAVHAALNYLRDRFAADVPELVIEQLARARTSRIERWDFHAQGAPPTMLWQVARYTTRYARLSRGRSTIERALGAPVILQEMLGLQSAWRVPHRLLCGRTTRAASPRQA
jgi:Uncharacterised nucleotidyltransferase